MLPSWFPSGRLAVKTSPNSRNLSENITMIVLMEPVASESSPLCSGWERSGSAAWNPWRPSLKPPIYPCNLQQSQLKPFSPNYSLASGLNSSSSLFVSLSTVLLSVLQANGQTEMKRVVGNNATLPCHHHLWQADISLLDIEWMLHKSSSRQKVVSMTTCVCVWSPATATLCCWCWPSLFTTVPDLQCSAFLLLVFL